MMYSSPRTCSHLFRNRTPAFSTRRITMERRHAIACPLSPSVPR